jgi:hypothetical protein
LDEGAGGGDGALDDGVLVEVAADDAGAVLGEEGEEALAGREVAAAAADWRKRRRVGVMGGF